MTVSRREFIEFWPLVDVAKLDLKPGDVVIVRSPKLNSDPLLRAHFGEVWLRHMPGIGIMFEDGTTTFTVLTAMREAEDGDLYPHERHAEGWRYRKNLEETDGQEAQEAPPAG